MFMHHKTRFIHSIVLVLSIIYPEFGCLTQFRKLTFGHMNCLRNFTKSQFEPTKVQNGVKQCFSRLLRAQKQFIKICMRTFFLYANFVCELYFRCKHKHKHQHHKNQKYNHMVDHKKILTDTTTSSRKL